MHTSKNQTKIRQILTLLITTLVYSTSYGTIWRYIDCSNASIDSTTYDFTDNGVNYGHNYKGPNKVTKPNIKKPWISPTLGGLTYRALSQSPYNLSVSDKTEHVIVRTSGANAPRYPGASGWRSGGWYIGFKMKLVDGFRDIRGRMLFFQAWQGSGPSNVSTPGYNPPLRFTLKPGQGNGNQVLQIYTKNDNNVPYQGSSATQHLETPLADNTWHKFIVHMRPSYSGDGQTGELRVWLNGNLILSRTQAGGNGLEWGYRPDLNNGVQEKLALTLGIYRAQQDREHTISFDEIRYGTSREEVDPSGIITKYHRLQNKASGAWFRPKGTNGATNETVPLAQIGTSATGDWTRFYFNYTGSNSYRMINKASGAFFRPKGGSYATNGSASISQTSTGNTGDWTKWKLLDLGSDTFRIVNKKSNQFVRPEKNGGVSSATDESAVLVQTSSGNTGDWTKWRLIDAGNR